MTRFFDFSLPCDGISGVRVLVRHEELSAKGDVESEILNGVVGLRGHDPSKQVAEILISLLEDEQIRSVLVIRNPAVVLDKNLPARVAKVVASLPAEDEWSIIGAGGLGPSDRRHMAIYASATPAIPDCSGPQPLLDVMPDIFLVNADLARQVLVECAHLPETALEPVLVTEGYLRNRCAIYSPQLTAGVNGSLLARDINALTEEMSRHFSATLAGQQIETLAGPVSIPAKQGNPWPRPRRHLGDKITSAIERHCAKVSLSIVVRTRFERTHLLDRLLASLTRNERSLVEFEVLLSTDVPPVTAQEQLSRLQQDFCNIDIRLQVNSPAVHSRVNNMIYGLRAARHDYVMLIDDDDYVDLFALQAISRSRFMGNRPLIVTGAEVHNETWEETPSGRWVLSQSALRDSYSASGWRNLFGGVNQLPICALIVPREKLCKRLDLFTFDHDLSEDYALFLLTFADRQLPAIFEVRETFCHISIRGRDNSVTMEDRRPWVRDIVGYLTDLTSKDAVAGAGFWALLSKTQTSSAEVSLTQSVTELRNALDSAQRDAALLQQENERLRRQRNLSCEAMQ